MVKEWIVNNYTTGDIPITGTCIAWGQENFSYGVYTSIDNFIVLFGTVIQSALDNGVDVKQAIRDSDPENSLGFNDYL
ncbi:hypothetical protein PMSD_04285 [Paenibacillus macquariensis subsp. defensor]|nr:hypothetical protein PMSD_04285 [Paenibacillus macquariensis subsp. defensor]